MAKIKDEDIDALRDGADIVDVISGYTQLKKAGGQSFKGLCPFHAEKTPSFSVDAGRGLWFCFGCGEGGNIYQFIQKAENLPFVDAVEWLARKSNFGLHYENERPGDKRAQGQKARVLAANEAAAKFFHRSLMQAPEAAEARRYLSGRGFTQEVAERWMLGWAPGRDSLCRHLQQRGFTNEEIVRADLGRRSEKDARLYDTFRERIMFPTWNERGDLVAFGGRALGDAQPKYLNTAETAAFSKSRVMFGLNRAKSALGRGLPAVVVEGYTDVISLHEGGIEQAVATNGVALAESHFELLKKFTGRAILMFDSDEAGKGATERGFGIHHRIGLEVLVAPLPPGNDPAEVIAQEGSDAILKYMQDAVPLMQFKLDQTIDNLPLDTPEARSRAVREAAQVLGWHPDPVARHQYAFSVAQRIGVTEEAVHRALSEFRSGPEATGGAVDRERDRRFPGHVKVEREALRLLVAGVEQVAAWAGQLSEDDFTAPPRRELLRRSREALSVGRPVAGSSVADDLSPEARSLLSELSVGFEDVTLDPRDVDELFVRLQSFRLDREIKARRKTLQEVNPLVDATKHDELFTELVRLEAERRDLLRRLTEDES